MKQIKVGEYRPNYPKKLIKGAALTAAALLAIGGAACDVRTGGVPLPDETPALVLDGEVAIDGTEESDDLLLGGEPLPEDTPEAQAHTRDGEPALLGKLVADEP